MSSPKSGFALQRLGRDLRSARLRRRMPVADLAVRSGTSCSTLARLEKGDAGVGIGVVADVLVALGLIDRLAELVDVRSDDLGLALAQDSLPKRGRSVRYKKTSVSPQSGSASARPLRPMIDPEGEAF